MRKILNTYAILVATALSACGGGGDSISTPSSGTGSTSTATKVNIVTTSTSSISDFWGNTAQVSATPKDASGNLLASETVQWSSSDPSVASVNSSGLVTMIKPGTANITAQSGGVSSTPVSVQVQGFGPVLETAMEHTCTVTESRTKVYCWGDQYAAAFNRGEITGSHQPKAINPGAVPAGSLIRQISSSFKLTCLLTDVGDAYCWNTYSASSGAYLGYGSNVISNLPVAVAQGERPAGVKFSKLSAGAGRVCALGTDGNLYCWGESSGMPPLALPWATVPQYYNVPVLIAKGVIASSDPIVDVGTSINTVCVITASGRPYCEIGGVLTAVDRSEVPVNAKLVSIRSEGWVGDYFALLADDGSAYILGSGTADIFGAGALAFESNMVLHRIAQGDIPAGAKITAVSRGGASGAGCVLTNANGVHCWGRNYYGSTGNGSLTDSTVLVPTKIVQGELPTSERFIDVKCGQFHCTGYASDKLICSWGYSEGNVLGRASNNVSSTSSGSPILVSTPYRD